MTTTTPCRVRLPLLCFLWVFLLCGGCGQDDRAGGSGRTLFGKGGTIADSAETPEERTGHFVTTWQVGYEGSMEPSLLELRTGKGEFEFDVDWEDDGVFDELGATETVSHTYETPGVYTLRIRGKFPHLKLGKHQGLNTLLTVEQWGSNRWGSMSEMFAGAGEVRFTALDLPNLEEVQDMSRMFAYSRFDDSLERWDVGEVRDMSAMFEYARNFNQPLNAWDVSNVRDMRGMFQGGLQV